MTVERCDRLISELQQLANDMRHANTRFPGMFPPADFAEIAEKVAEAQRIRADVAPKAVA